ncbi:MAG: hypothetical protein JW794_00050 [Candidatus Cloacimonetes bacterium]|nr:hypothetical protein [Candidatus Cloacimonadota bacterium]
MKKIILGLTLLSLAFLMSCSSSTGSNESPTITFVHPQNNETINDSIYTIEVSVEDTKSIVSVSIYADSVCLYQSTDSKNYTCEWHTYWFTDSADHTIKVEATDSDDKTTTKSVDVTLSEQAYITPKPLTPANNATLQYPVNLTWTAIDNALSYEVDLVINSVTFPLTPATNSQTIDYTIYGAATWKVKAVDAFGMSTKYSEEYHFTVTETK